MAHAANVNDGWRGAAEPAGHGGSGCRGQGSLLGGKQGRKAGRRECREEHGTGSQALRAAFRDGRIGAVAQSHPSRSRRPGRAIEVDRKATHAMSTRHIAAIAPHPPWNRYTGPGLDSWAVLIVSGGSSPNISMTWPMNKRYFSGVAWRQLSRYWAKFRGSWKPAGFR